jgi:hypothetical protein
MPRKRMDCRGPVTPQAGNKFGNRRPVCHYCGRPIEFDTGDGKWKHRRGYKRMFPDPRKVKRDERSAKGV